MNWWLDWRLRWARLRLLIGNERGGRHSLHAVSQPAVRDRVREFLDIWQTQSPGLSAGSVALGLLAAARVEEYYRQYQRLELVWTGPDSQLIPLRRTGSGQPQTR